jgi:tetratricopeptide (TPR) repeat protein
MASKALHEQGVALFRQGKFDAALAKFNEALGEAGDDTRRAAEVYSDIGVTYKQLEDYPAAHQALDEAWQRFTTLADQKGQAQVLGNRAAVYEAEGALEQAVETYKQSVAIFEALGENEMAMYVWQAISRLRMSQKQYIAAIGAYEEGIDNMPKSSLKKKILQEILKVPRSMLGGSVKPDEPGQDD